MSSRFQVADINKSLIAVKGIVKKLNHVVFGPGREGVVS
jgi:hypothetical protein